MKNKSRQIKNLQDVGPLHITECLPSLDVDIDGL